MGLLTPGTLLQERYRIEQLIGQGGFGAVYQACDQRLDRRVALKQLLRGGDRVSRQFQREAQLLANLDHSALPRVTDHFAAEAGQFLVMDFMPGDDLGTLLLQRDAPFPLEQVLGWAFKLLDALHYLHSRQPPIVHRDIKPQNLKLKPDGSIMLLDFGLAKGFAGITPASTAERSLMAYTRGYAPPEQVEGLGTDQRSDLYALAATLFSLLTNVAPVEAQTRLLAAARGRPDPLRAAHEYNPEVPEAVSRVLEQAMALERDDRPPGAQAMRALLAAAQPDPRAEAVAAQYAAARRAADAQQWSVAVAQLEAVIGYDPAYRDAAALLSTARKNAALAELYAQARQGALAQDWGKVQALFARIHALEPGYGDPLNLLQAAQAALATRASRSPRAPRTEHGEAGDELDTSAGPRGVALPPHPAQLDASSRRGRSARPRHAPRVLLILGVALVLAAGLGAGAVALAALMRAGPQVADASAAGIVSGVPGPSAGAAPDASAVRGTTEGQTPPGAAPSAPARPSTLPPSVPPGAVSTPALAVALPPILTRADWGAAPPSAAYVEQVPQTILLHHDGVAFDDVAHERQAQEIRRIQSALMRDPGFVDLPWHYVVDLNGDIWAGRPPAAQGQTRLGYDPNGIVSIGMLGDYNDREPNQAQLDAIVVLVAWLCAEYRIDPAQVYGHGVWAARHGTVAEAVTSPGTNLQRYLDDGSLLARISAKLTSTQP